MSAAPDTGPAAAGSEALVAVAGRAARFKAFKDQHHIAFEVAFFFAGFLFDVVLLHRIDSVPLLVHQGSYLVLSAALIFWDHRIHTAGREPGGRLKKSPSAATRIGPLKTPAAPPKKACSMPGSGSAGTMWLSSR